MQAHSYTENMEAVNEKVLGIYSNKICEQMHFYNIIIINIANIICYDKYWNTGCLTQ